MARPYQPSLLRLLHGVTAALVLAAWLSGLVVYSRYDGRWGRLPFPPAGEWIDLHGTVGVVLLAPAVLFGLYALSLGWRRLRRPTNAVALLALVLAVGSGLLMEGDWLVEREFQHAVYSVHLLAWLLMAAAVLAHLGALAQLGGQPLLRSMLSLSTKRGDQPRDWFAQIRGHFLRPGARP
jgi:hypothetical protein